ncbi:hypothetical protein FisN_3Hh058 [Fistulifera solaris]|uniref:L domain-like protein n=1 Tax=Fistulifera solaris TaxID=1519565 RepID=A0A1Z5JPA5_FISSO|nr:hypothetical protein FisN_3Hh058 [Fistulifera solaris]|eukprot:GAX15588.1 hypothetical protein FisN_3Hh058 [Fistulifera solaris]
MTNEMREFPILSAEAAGSLSLVDLPVVTGRASANSGGDEEDNMDTVGMQQISLEDPEQAVQFEGASLPNPDELPASPVAVSSTRKRFVFRCFAATACLLVTLSIIFAIGLAVRPTNESSSSSSAGPRPTQQQVISFLVDHNVSSAEKLNDPNSMQFIAAQFLADIDPRKVPLPVADSNEHYATDVYMYTVRYVMVLLYTSWKGMHWKAQHAFMSSLDVCEWSAITISFDNPTMIEPGGVTCDPVSGLPIKLDLEFNSLMATHIPTELGLLTTLQFLDLEFNGQTFKGTIPTEICNLHQLVSLGMRSNGLHGKLPTCMGRMHKLQHLLLGQNELTGNIPTQLCELSNLKMLDLHRNLLVGEIPDCWGTETEPHFHLESFALSSNNLEGTLPSSLAHASSLTELFLDQNGLWDNPLSTINHMKQLEFLFLDQNQFEGALDHTFVRQATKLQALDVSGNKFTSEVFPSHLFKYSNLQLIDMSQNELKGSIPDNIALNDVMKFFAVYDNHLMWQIPQRISNLKSLEHLDLSYNYFNGTMPSELFQMPSLKRLFMSANPDLDRGTVPSDLSNMTGLTELSLKFTNRIGTLPDISALRNLTYLSLDNNHFHGAIPDHYGSAPSLQYLVLSRNPNLNGTVPSFAEATELVTAFLDGTKISGDLESICSLPVFQSMSLEEREANEWVVVANCGEANKNLSCSCCHCCLPEETDSDTGVCSDLAVDTLDWNWENQFEEIARKFGFDASRVASVVSNGVNSRA